jgi:predicted RNase H-like HicB family nuclease
MPLRQSLSCFIKYLLSYTKKEWTVDDYPLRYNGKNSVGSGDPNLTWSAKVIKWPTLVGIGPTKEAAYKNLEENFKLYKAANATLPRPGKEVPVTFAKTDQIFQLEDIAEDFFPAILGYNFHGVFVSDESSIFDFGEDEAEAIAAINSKYGLQLTTLGDGNIVHILKLIKNERKRG